MISQAKKDAIYAVLTAYHETTLESDEAISAIEGIFITEQSIDLRDQIAIAALTGMLADPNVIDGLKTAKTSYELADAMLEARKK